MKIRVLEEQLRLQLIAKYGPASDKLSDQQLNLLEQEPGVSHTEVEAESQREPVLVHLPPLRTNANIPDVRNCHQTCRG